MASFFEDNNFPREGMIGDITEQKMDGGRVKFRMLKFAVNAELLEKIVRQRIERKSKYAFPVIDFTVECQFSMRKALSFLKRLGKAEDIRPHEDAMDVADDEGSQ